MNNLILTQLKLCKVANVGECDLSTTFLHINKIGSANGETVLPNHYYLIELDDYIFTSDKCMVIHQNWNHNLPPKSRWYKCECLQIMGDMMKIDGAGYNKVDGSSTGEMWSGWLPLSHINILSEI